MYGQQLTRYPPDRVQPTHCLENAEEIPAGVRRVCCPSNQTVWPGNWWCPDQWIAGTGSSLFRPRFLICSYVYFFEYDCQEISRTSSANEQISDSKYCIKCSKGLNFTLHEFIIAHYFA